MELISATPPSNPIGVLLPEIPNPRNIQNCRNQILKRILEAYLADQHDRRYEYDDLKLLVELEICSLCTVHHSLNDCGSHYNPEVRRPDKIRTSKKRKSEGACGTIVRG
ncbi:hypothetical protein V6N13_075040 [Hibiscus sabdariffa]|uniref:Uncharacterized protein n=1 Tax=Hibiscus sabdariffa TaxID=183260 RepID=A0ABR2UB16_9ROSI